MAEKSQSRANWEREVVFHSLFLLRNSIHHAACLSLSIEYSANPFLLFGVLVLYKSSTRVLRMNKKLLIGLLAFGVTMLVVGLVIMFVGLP